MKMSHKVLIAIAIVWFFTGTRFLGGVAEMAITPWLLLGVVGVVLLRRRKAAQSQLNNWGPPQGGEGQLSS